jgi:hypothetical protein
MTAYTGSDEIAYFGYEYNYDDPIIITMVLAITRSKLEMTDNMIASVSLNISGVTTFNNATSILSSLNVSGNIIGSGTVLTNLNYNAITITPDLTVYATNTNLSRVSNYSYLNINTTNTNLNSLSPNSSDDYHYIHNQQIHLLYTNMEP